MLILSFPGENTLLPQALNLALTLALAVASACSSDKGESPPAPAPSPPPAAARPSDASPDAAPTEPELAPLPVPAKRYGEPDRPRITAPVEVAPVPDGSVVLVLVDALNADHLSSYGYSRPTTPRIDRLAAEGIRFTNWISNSSWTRPSFTTMITGQPKREHGVELNATNLGRKVATIAERFKAAGFKTGGFVGNPLVRKLFGYDQGFDVYHDTKDHPPFPRGRILVDKALAWLDRVGDRPFFLLLFLTDPHTPYRPVEGYRQFMKEVGAESNTEYPLREYVEPLPKAEHDAIVAAYDGEVAYADAQIGRLVDGLEGRGLRGRTTVVVTADHGEMFGEHNCYLHSYHMWEPALRVPFVLSSPAIAARDVIEDRPYTHLDLVPTLLALHGVEPSAELMGRAYTVGLGDPQVNRGRWLFSQYNARGVRRQAMRLGRWKLIHHHPVDRQRFYTSLERQREATDVPRADPRKLPSVSFDEERYELYNLVDDPAEQDNLYAANQDATFVRELKEEMDKRLRKRAKNQPPPELSQETLEALKAAGYIR